MNYNFGFLGWVQSALFPLKCLVCATEGKVLCERHQNLKPAGLIDLAPKGNLEACFAAVDYNQKGAQSLVKALKFKRHQAAGEIIAKALAERLPWEDFSGATLIPMPLHWRRQHWRGFNQAVVIAQNLQPLLNLTLDSTSLKRVKYTSQQARLGRRDRSSNLEKAFRWKSEKIVPETVLLLDDVMTTGSTLEAAARALKAAGVKQVFGLTFAYQRHDI
jgi:ComF family protein